MHTSASTCRASTIIKLSKIIKSRTSRKKLRGRISGRDGIDISFPCPHSKTRPRWVMRGRMSMCQQKIARNRGPAAFVCRAAAAGSGWSQASSCSLGCSAAPLMRFRLRCKSFRPKTRSFGFPIAECNRDCGAWGKFANSKGKTGPQNGDITTKCSFFLHDARVFSSNS